MRPAELSLRFLLLFVPEFHFGVDGTGLDNARYCAAVLLVESAESAVVLSGEEGVALHGLILRKQCSLREM